MMYAYCAVHCGIVNKTADLYQMGSLQLGLLKIKNPSGPIDDPICVG